MNFESIKKLFCEKPAKYKCRHSLVHEFKGYNLKNIFNWKKKFYVGVEDCILINSLQSGIKF